MNRSFHSPRLPGRQVKLALVSGEYPFLALRLQELGIGAIETFPDPRLPTPVRFHPDMQVCILGNEHLFVLQETDTLKQLKASGIDGEETERKPGSSYPRDVLCNAFVLDGFLVGNMDAVDPRIRNAADEIGLRQLTVRQGYAACSTVLVNRNSAITADPGIASALTRAGIKVLSIRPGFIELPGYDSGFLGGCCGLLAPDQMAFTGALASHPDGDAIQSFLKAHGVGVLELWDGPLLDVGGILPLR